MKVPVDWLKEFVLVKSNRYEIVKRLTDLGALVESSDQNILEIEVTPNRPDWLSIIGIARELAADQSIKLPQYQKSDHSWTSQSQGFRFKFDRTDLFWPYRAVIIENVEIKKSPALVSKRLKKVGIRSINNVVDATNYAMFHFGFPLHAFDLDQFDKPELKFRLSKPRELITTLDRVRQELPKDVLVAESGAKLVDLCGIKGGLASSISPKTSRVLIHAARYDPRVIRRAIKSIGFGTEASYRFERGVDTQAAKGALELAFNLISQSSAKARVRRRLSFGQDDRTNSISFEPDLVSKMVGARVEPELSRLNLERLGFSIDKNWRVSVPSWRQRDISLAQDLVEEVIRLAGLDKIIKISSAIKPSKQPSGRATGSWLVKQKIRQFLSLDLGMNEILSYSLVSRAQLKALGFRPEQSVRVVKTISPEHEYFRPTILIGCLRTLVLNSWMADQAVFELGQIFRKGKIEEYIILAGPRSIAQKIPQLPWQELNPASPLAKLEKLRRPITWCELSIGQFLKLNNVTKLDFSPLAFETGEKKIRQFSGSAPVTRDISIMVDQKFDSKEIADAIKSVSPTVILCEMFDHYRSALIGSGRDSYAFHLIFDDLKKRLTRVQVDKIMNLIIKKLVVDFKAVIR